MKKALLIIGIAVLAGTFSAAAETAGRIINAPYFDISQRMLFSQNDYVFGTSRSLSMGGAFTSLGADLSSMNINPAGLGMYRSSDIGITQGLSITGTRGSLFNNAGTNNFASGGSLVSYGLDNAAVVFNVFDSSKTLTSLSLGFGYNRAANFNSRSFFQTTGNTVSIADMFGHQLAVMSNTAGIGASELQSSARPFENENIYLDEWGAVLGYQTGMINNRGADYEVALGPNALTDSYTRSITKGGIYEYSLSAGANINNILYLGATLGVSQIEYKELLTYEESFYNQGTDAGLVNSLWYDQTTDISGEGYTMKLGAVIRPIEPLRIGVAFHLPTYYTINKHYYGEMGTDLPRSANTGGLEDQQRFSTAPKLLAGASIVIGKRAILAVDYERTWYNKVHTRSDNLREVEDSKAESAALFRPGYAFRTGLEILVNDAVSLRLGGGYQDSSATISPWATNTPIASQSCNVTAGLGFKIGQGGYIDVAYLYKRTGYNQFENYYLSDDGNSAYQVDDLGGGVTLPRMFGQTRNYHLISLTLGSRF
jgi:hypothetical protein